MKTSSLVASVLFLITGCTLGPPMGGLSSGSSSGLQILPNSTTASVNEAVNLQISGGTPPYQFRSYGVGSVDTYGNYQAGAYPGQSQVQVTDAYGNTAVAVVNVVQTSSNSYPTYAQTSIYRQLTLQGTLSPQAPAHGWSVTTSAELRQSPWIRGQLIGSEDSALPAAGESLHSQFIKTDLRHPVVRLDRLMEGRRTIAARAVVEDQFLVTLQPASSEGDLSSVLTSTGARISRRLASGAYLISMGQTPGGAGISADFFAQRAELKRQLQAIAVVSPNYISRAPASQGAGARDPNP